MPCTTRRIALAAMLLLVVTTVVIAIYGPNVTRAQQQRTDFERYLYRAVESCQAGNFTGAYGLLSRAQSLAPSPAEEQYARDLIPKFRAGDCRLTPDRSPDDGAIPVP